MNTHPLPPTWDPTGEIARSLAHGHGINTTSGYRVVRVDDHGQYPDRLIATFPFDEYLLADTFRRDLNLTTEDFWYAIDTGYDCGCWTVTRPDLGDNVEEGR